MILCSIIIVVSFCYRSDMSDCSDIVLSQYAQDPLENFTQQCEDLFGMQLTKTKTGKKRKRESVKKNGVSSKSFVIRKEQKGSKLIQIKIFEMMRDATTRVTTQDSDVEGEADNLVLSAQYVAQDPVDEIIDLTETLVRKISKKLCGDHY